MVGEPTVREDFLDFISFRSVLIPGFMPWGYVRKVLVTVDCRRVNNYIRRVGGIRSHFATLPIIVVSLSTFYCTGSCWFYQYKSATYRFNINITSSRIAYHLKVIFAGSFAHRQPAIYHVEIVS
jgi:hypothetical protein